MRKLISLKSLLLTLLLLFSIASFSQTAVNFNCNDCAGTNHDLFAEHDAGKVIVICWVMPCASCKATTLTTYNVVKSYEAAYPGRVKLYIVDDYANTTCASLNSWCNSNGFTDALRFSNASIKMTDYGTVGMPKVVVTGNTTHHVYYNSNNTVNATLLQNAITQAINEFAVSNEKPENTKETIFPNPADNKAVIDLQSFGSNNVSVKIFNAEGKELHTGQIKTNSGMEISTENLPSGIYVVIVESATIRKSFKLLVSHQEN